MSIKLYDDAIAEKIKRWVLDPKIRVLKPDETQRLFEMTLDETKDKPLTLPLIAISRDRNIEILNTQKQPKTYDGVTLWRSGEQECEKKSIPLNAIPIQLSYQLDIYTRLMEEADEYIRNFVFNLINYPKLLITIPYNSINFTHQSIISLDSSISDNSDIKEHLFPDQFTRFTLKLYIEDAYLFSAPVIKDTMLTGYELYIREKTDPEKLDEIEESVDVSNEEILDTN